MNFQDTDNSMPAVIYEGYKFPSNYAVFGEVNLHELNEDNSSAVIYVGNRSEIQKLITEIAETLQDYNDSYDNFIVVGLWDNNFNKKNDDYIMLSTIVSNSTDNLLEFVKTFNGVYQLTDNSTSDSDAWRAWSNLSSDYISKIISQEEAQKIATVLLSNVSDNMINNFREHEDNDFLKRLIPSTRKFKVIKF